MEKKKLKCIQVYPLKLTTLLITEFQSSQELTTTTSWIQGKFPIKIWGLSWRTAWIWRGCSCWKTAATSSPTPTTSPSINEMLKGYFFQKLVELNELRNGNFQGWFSRCIFEVVIKSLKSKKKVFQVFQAKNFLIKKFKYIYRVTTLTYSSAHQHSFSLHQVSFSYLLICSVNCAHFKFHSQSTNFFVSHFN